MVMTHVDDRGGLRGGRIVEVEAYCGESDPASHAFGGLTPRTAVMFGPPGHLYVYRSYGMHWCSNVVCLPEGTAGAVLVRALEPVVGVDAMWPARPKAHRPTDLASGPGKLGAALGITGADNGDDLLGGNSGVHLWCAARVRSRPELGQGPRVGISKAVAEPWRWWEAENRHVSRGPVRLKH